MIRFLAVRVSSQTRTRRNAGHFGAFRPVRARKASALLRPTETKIPRNLLALRSKILKRADFCSAAAKTQRILYVFASILTMDERKSDFSKRGSGLIAHPKINLYSPKGCQTLRWITVHKVYIHQRGVT